MYRRYKVEINPIKSDEDYRDALARVAELTDATPDSQEEDELDVLASLIEIYEAR